MDIIPVNMTHDGSLSALAVAELLKDIARQEGLPDRRFFLMTCGLPHTVHQQQQLMDALRHYDTVIVIEALQGRPRQILLRGRDARVFCVNANATIPHLQCALRVLCRQLMAITLTPKHLPASWMLSTFPPLSSSRSRRRADTRAQAKAQQAQSTTTMTPTTTTTLPAPTKPKKKPHDTSPAPLTPPIASVDGRHLALPVSLYASAGLTANERAVLRLLLRGLNPTAIGQCLNKSDKTISTHKRNLMDKLGVYTIAELHFRLCVDDLTSRRRDIFRVRIPRAARPVAPAPWRIKQGTCDASI